MEINLTKSKLFFFNTSIPVQRNLSKILKIQRNSLPTKYLGIPLSEYTPKAANWEDLLNKMKARLSSWTHRALNMASRLVLVKSVLQTMPAYMLSALAAPKTVYKSIQNIQRSFLWNVDSKKCKWALLKWMDICKQKLAGGLGFKYPEILSKVVVAKIWWRWVENPNSLWGTLWKAKYANQVQDKDLIRLTGNTQGSPFWNKVWENQHIVQKHSFWEVHQSNTALFWEDAWQQLPPLDHPDWTTLKNDMQEAVLRKVADYWHPQTLATTWQKWLTKEQWLTQDHNGNIEHLLQ